MTIHHRPGDPRRDPRLCEDWEADAAPGLGIARAIVYTIAGLIVLAAIAWSIV